MNLNDATNIYAGNQPVNRVMVGAHQAWPTIHSQGFAYTGSPQEFMVPEGITEISVVLLGASGGVTPVSPDGYNSGGYGARITSVLAVTPGETLQVIVGGAGNTESSITPSGGGWPNGGHGGPGTDSGGAFSTGRTGSSGGAWTALYRGSTLLACAGGGGGAGTGRNQLISMTVGGNGGANGSNSVGGAGGGTQIAGGSGAAAGTAGQGGSSTSSGANIRGGGGGGGGLYGGGAGASNTTNANKAGGGGGSSTSTGTSTVILDGANAGDGYAWIGWNDAVAPSPLPFVATWTGGSGVLWTSSWIHQGSNATVTQNGSGGATLGFINNSTSYALLRKALWLAEDVDVVASVLPTNSNSQIRLIVRWDGNTSGTTGDLLNGYVMTFGIGAANTIQIRKYIAGVETRLDSITHGVLSGEHVLRFQAQGSMLRAKWWPSSSTEPASWGAEITDTSITGSGSVGLANLRVTSSGLATVSSFVASAL